MNAFMTSSLVVLLACPLLAQQSSNVASSTPPNPPSKVFIGKARDLQSHAFRSNDFTLSLHARNVIGGGIPSFILRVENIGTEIKTFNPNDLAFISSTGYQHKTAEITAYAASNSIATPSPISLIPGAYTKIELVLSGATIGINPPIKVYLSGQLLAEISEK